MRQSSDPPAAVRSALIRFVRTLRSHGMTTPADAGMTAGQALAAVGFEDRERCRAALRSTLVTSPAEAETFEQFFPAFWSDLQAALAGQQPDRAHDGTGQRRTESHEGSQNEPSETRERDPAEGHGNRTATGEPDERGKAASVSDVSPGRRVGESFDDAFAPAEAAGRGSHGPSEGIQPGEQGGMATDIEDAVAALGTAIAREPGPRFRRRGTDRIAPRRALRKSVETGGAPLPLPKDRPQRTSVRAAVLVDVSESMLDVLDRSLLLATLHEMIRQWRHVRVFLFDTELREVSASLDARSPVKARQALAEAEAEWGGGTRIGESFAKLRTETPEAVDRRTTTIVISDGLETGSIDALRQEVAWLARRNERLLWLNPLALDPEFRPTARGMAAAAPFLDGLFGFAGPQDLWTIVEALERGAERGGSVVNVGGKSGKLYGGPVGR